MNLLMLTKFYPYGTGEAFIENEIKVVSGYFEEIVIIACEVPKTESRIRALPNNVISYRLDAGRKKIDVLEGNLKFALSRNEVLVEERKYCKGIKKKVFLYYFEEKSQRVYEMIISRGYLDNITKKPFMLYSYWFYMTALVGGLIANKYKPVLMFTRAHGYDLYEYRNSLNYLPLRRYLLNTYNFIFPCSYNGTEYLSKNYPEYTKKIRTAYLGTIDHGMGRPSEDGIFRIVSCSRIAPEKRVTEIVKTLKLLDDDKKNIEWHHLGDGLGMDEIKKECSEFKNIRCYFYGDVPNNEVINKYKEIPFDLFLNVSNSEGLPVSIMEAMSFGFPVIATDVGGTKEIVINEVTGRLLDKNFDNKTLSNEILKFINMSKEEYLSYRKHCRSKWEESFQAIYNYTKLCEFVTKEDIE